MGLFVARAFLGKLSWLSKLGLASRNHDSDFLQREGIEVTQTAEIINDCNLGNSMVCQSNDPSHRGTSESCQPEMEEEPLPVCPACIAHGMIDPQPLTRILL